VSRRVHATLEFEADADPIRGRITTADGHVEFVGWLELMALLDRMVSTQTSKENP
jgi:hypothetical protein